MILNKLKNKTIESLFWSFADNLLQQIVNFIVGIILARLLSPEDFGLIGIISVFIAMSNIFVNSGLSDALINKNETTDIDYNTVFWTNIFLGIITYFSLFFIAPYVAFFFKNDELILLIRITALSVLIVSFSSIQRAILTRFLNFKIITVISMISVFVSGSIAIYMAFNGFGVLSLVIRMVLGQAMTFLLFWIINKWRPKFIFDLSSLKSLYSFGSNLFLSRFINTLYNNIYYFIIGKLFSPSALGYYTRAETFNNLASSNISNTIQRVSFAVLSSKRSKEDQFNTFNLFFNMTILITFSLMAILFVSANEIILILLGEKWIQSIIYLKLLIFSGMFFPLYSLNLNLFAVTQNTKYYLKLELIVKLFIIPTIIAGYFYGLISLIIMMVLSSFLSYLTTLISIKKILDYNIRIQIKAFITCIFLFIMIVLFGYLVDNNLKQNNYIMLLLKVAISSTISFICFILYFPDLFKKLKLLIKN